MIAIVNCTPDSFSGDGVAGAQAYAALSAQVEAGADILDLGAESTRPGARVVTPDEEWQRLAPVLAACAQAPWRAAVRLSVDTRHAQTAQRALAAGAQIINDVSGGADASLLQTVAAHGAQVMLMHALSVPADPGLRLAEDVDVVAFIADWATKTSAKAQAFGITPSQLWLDPGIGFGKSARQSLALIDAAATLVADGRRWVYGHSRKSFLALFDPDASPAARDPLTLLVSHQLALAGVSALRVHHVARHHQFFAGDAS